MFCKNCGNNIDEGSRFCPTCGEKTEKERKIDFSSVPTDNDEPLLVLKPVFIKETSLIASIFLGFFLSVWGLGFVGGILGMILMGIFTAMGGNFELGGLVAVFGFLIIPFIVISLMYRSTKKANEKTWYKFYSDRVEYVDGYLVKNKQVVMYSRINGVTTTAGMFQQKYNCGSLILDTAGKSITIKNIEDFENIYYKVNSLLM